MGIYLHRIYAKAKLTGKSRSYMILYFWKWWWNYCNSLILLPKAGRC